MKAARKKGESKNRLHPRNKNRDRYDLNALVEAYPDLNTYISLNKHGVESVDFSNPKAVKLLNKALLKHYYDIAYWEFSDENLCPPIPGRADYIHHIADLLRKDNDGRIPRGKGITCLDIGVGASCIYPIIGAREYGWTFIASDTELKSIESAKNIVSSNPSIADNIQCKWQKNPQHFFRGVIKRTDKIDISICNPPFHATKEDAIKGTQRKVKNLSGKKTAKPILNFSGNLNELIYPGGEVAFIKNMIQESKLFAQNCKWFTTLVSKQANLKYIYKELEAINAQKVETIEMGTGNKTSRVVAWTFLSTAGRKLTT